MTIRALPSLRWPKSLWSYNPTPTGCVLFLPLWSPGLNGSIFKSVDLYNSKSTVTGALRQSDGRLFDGSDDKIEVVANPAFVFTSTFTLEAWVKLTSAIPDQHHPIIEIGEGPERMMFVARRITTGKVAVFNSEGGGFPGIGGPLDADTWYHIVVIIGLLTKLLFYFNGAFDSESIGTTTAFPNWAGACRIGGSIAGGTTYLKGSIGEVRIYNRALTVGEILHNYNATSWRYL